MPPSKSQIVDVAIVGGGLIGGSLAIALCNSGYKIALVEANAHDQNNPSFDNRTVALVHSSVRIFSNLGLWQQISNPSPIETIHVSRRGHIGSSVLSANDCDLDALGFVVANKEIGKVLWHQLHDSTVQIHCPASPVNIVREQDRVRVELEDGALEAKLLILADGGRSKWSETLGFNGIEHDYGKDALITFVDVDRPHNFKAWERFGDDGPVALLPYGENRYVVAWTVAREATSQLRALTNEAFIHRLQQTFGYRAGRILSAREPLAYPLKLTEMDRLAHERVLLIGNAAHQVHPVAGQGFNLGLRDVARLHQLLIDAHKWQDDPGAQTLLQQYASETARDARAITRFTDGLLSIFQYNNPLVAIPRSMGLGLIDKIPPVRRAILSYSTGLNSIQNSLNRND